LKEQELRVSARPLPPPLAGWTLWAASGALIALTKGQAVPGQEWAEDRAVLLQGQRQLEAYIRGERRTFDLPLRPEGTPFQQAVWAALQTIPYGETWSYGQVAAALGRPKAVRAVGGACHRNPLPILIPCHLVVSAHGGLGGYALGRQQKEQLLALERRSREGIL
jgi:methylated-DNA-[protein]-cysteine S-methyltransferase